MAQSTSAGIGFSSEVEVTAAVAESLSAALAGGESPPRLAIVYASVTYDHAALLAALRERLPDVVIVGASAGGASINGLVTEAPRFLAITVLRSHAVRARAALARSISADPRRAGRELARQLGQAPPGPSQTFVWYDPLTGANIAELLAGLADGGYPSVVGGAAGQPLGPRVATFQFCGESAVSDGAVALAIDGLTGVLGLTHGADPLGLELSITRATDNIIEELDGQPALDVCCEQLGVESFTDQASTANWALGIKPSEGVSYEGLLTRGAFGVDVERKTITLQVPIAEGTRVQICVRTREAVLDRAFAMARRVAEEIAGKRPVLALGFECAARPPFLGPAAMNHEVVTMQELIGASIPWLGIHAWGELAPIGGRSEFHNHTFPLVVLCDP